MDREQRIRDPIHNLISFSNTKEEDRLLWELLQTGPVQRLRRIKQLGFSEFVYPGATHTRFSHILGAMHMARRMLAVFERNDVFNTDAKHTQLRKATLAAALLHDVGHGPYSHVFEEVSAHFKIKMSHEDYTRAVIEETEIKKILEKYAVFDDTVKFFKTEPGYDPYTIIISSQMDCDRLDFLARDRYHTGIRSSAIDLEWLFDSLRIEEVVVEPISGIKYFAFVVLRKGISVTEEFVISYLKMYQNVYFHKTTRGVQYLVKDILVKIVENGIPEGLKDHPLIKYFGTQNPSLDVYLSLDDGSVVSLIHLIANADFGEATRLAKRYLGRDLYKCLELPTSSKGTLRSTLVGKFVEALKAERIQFFPDIVPSKSYKQFAVMAPDYLKNIFVRLDNEHEALGEVSDLVNSIPPQAARLYFANEEIREQARVLLRKCIAA